MEKVRVALGERSYDILIERGSIDSIGEKLKGFQFSTTIALVSNPTVFDLYGKRVVESLQHAGFATLPILIPDGEAFKDYQWSSYILTELLKNKLGRNSCVAALGGGVIGDTTGFCASIYMRGTQFVQIPTTLLAQVDSSVGGKTGVNHYLGKNMIGTFYQPRLVLMDTATLETLPRRELLCGIAEVIKYGVIWDSKLFEFMEQKRDHILSLHEHDLHHIIKRSCEIKAAVVEKDERESGLRAILNYGHTIGHAIETETGYTEFLHGEAVAIGMQCEAQIAESMGLFKKEDRERLRALLEAFHLPTALPQGIDVESLLRHMRLDKKAVGGKMKFILPEGIGKVRIESGVSTEVIRKALAQ